MNLLKWAMFEKFLVKFGEFNVKFSYTQIELNLDRFDSNPDFQVVLWTNELTVSHSHI